MQKNIVFEGFKDSSSSFIFIHWGKLATIKDLNIYMFEKLSKKNYQNQWKILKEEIKNILNIS